jgi:hypothetical protein
MRLILFLLLFLPNITAADKASRDQAIEILTELYECTGYIYPWGENALLTREDRKLVQEPQLILQFEYDEEFFSVENLVKLQIKFEKKLNEQLGKKMEMLSAKLSESEAEYIGLKIANLNPMTPPDKLSDIGGFWPDDIKKIARNIRKCVKKYQLN